jgi:hypothetical protein
MASFPDVLENWINDWRKLARAGIALAFTLLMLFGLVASLKWLFEIGGAEVRVSSEGPQVFFETASGVKTYYVVVHPQGWQKTMIQLRKNDRVAVHAEGSINIDLYGLIDAVEKRRALETKTAQKYHITASSSDVPEIHYTDEEWAQIRPTRPWMGPQGIAGFVPSFGGRRNLKLLPEAPHGALVGAIKTGNSESDPPMKDAFVIGADAQFPVQNDGQLWLTVNDITNEKYSQMFYLDNVGFYSALVTVTPAESEGWFVKLFSWL